MPDAHHPRCAGSADLGHEAAGTPEGREATLTDIVKKRCLLAGIDEPFSAHSLRSGFVTEAG